MTRTALRSRIVTFAKRLLVVEFVAAVAAIAYAGLHDMRDVFRGAPDGAAASVAASCAPPGAPSACASSVEEVSAGRYRVAAAAATRDLSVTLTPVDDRRAHQLLVRISQPPRVRLAVTSAGASQPPIDLIDEGGRTVVPVAAGPVVLRFSSDGTAPIVVAEAGLFDAIDGLLIDARPAFTHIPPARYHGTLVPRAVAALALFTILVAAVVPLPLRRIAPAVLALVAFSMCIVDLEALYCPYSNQDLRTFYAGGALQEPVGNNLNTGIWQGWRVLHGQGLTLRDGIVPWERMPGYGLFCAVSGALFGHATPIDLVIATVLSQTLLYSAAVGVFVWAAMAIMPPAAAWSVGLLTAWLPKELALTQVDAVIAPAALLMLAALCVRLGWAARERTIPVWLDVAVHATFALWFVMRPDVLPGWILVSLWLHRRDWRRLAIPAALFLAIGGAWGAYKMRYTGEFALTTTSAGASLFCGLWEVPSRFALTCSDPSYFAWIHAHTPFQPQSSSANSFATREVIRFWLTYPGHVVLMLDHKMMQMLDGDLWPGYPTQLQVFVFGVVRRYWLVQALVTVIALCVVVGHRRERTLLLSWPLWFDAPLFWIMFASLGRFYSGVGLALVAAAVPPLFERSFYGALASRPRRTAAVMACALVWAIAAWPLHDWLLRRDAFHYWAPLLDPARSALSGLK